MQSNRRLNADYDGHSATASEAFAPARELDSRRNATMPGC
jgi:hypothetical protein